ncbi:MAG TPA: MscL family protein [Candidatus Aenigmarchaeota archaeon]|nr:MscL family protein [Candidatus Aenigmarchaeota archaeon]
MSFLTEFKEFLQEYKIMALAIAFVMGVAITAVVQSLVNDIIMPIISPLLPGGGWQIATFTIGPIVLKWGSFLGALINFVIIALVIFMMAKMMFKKEKK